MNEFIEALDRSVATGNWYGALFVALALPDICGKIDQPGENNSQRRYATWFDTYVRAECTFEVGSDREESEVLCGNDCYALRCAYLRDASDDIAQQLAKEAVEKFNLVVAPRGWTIKRNLMNTRLQLQVDLFCENIKQGVFAWLQGLQSDATKSEAVRSRLKVQFANMGGGIRL
jgi:hypothetical protein